MTAYTKNFSGVLTGMVIALSTFATPSHAQDAHYLSQDASHCEIFRGLSRDLPAECRTQTQKTGFRSLPPAEGSVGRLEELLTPEGFIATFPHRHGMNGSFIALLQHLGLPDNP